MLGFIGLMIATAVALASKLRTKTDSRCQTLMDEVKEKHPPNAKWNVESIMEVFDYKARMESAKEETDQRIGNMMEMCTLGTVGFLIGVILSGLGLFSESLSFLDFIICAAGALYSIRVLPTAWKLA